MKYAEASTYDASPYEELMKLSVQAIAEPLFCFETAFKLLALSRAAYAEDATPVGWETTCALPGTLQEAKDQHATDGCPRSPAEDSKCKCYCSSPTCREVCVMALILQKQPEAWML